MSALRDRDDAADPSVAVSQRLDLRLLPAAAGAEAGAAIGLAVPWRTGLLLALVGLFGGVAAAGRARRSVAPVWSVLVCLLLVLAASVFGTAVRVRDRRGGPVSALATQESSGRVEVVLNGDPRLASGSVRGDALRPASVVVDARLERVSGPGGRSWRVRQPVLMIAPAGTWSALLPSQRVTAAVRLEPPRGSDVAAVLLARGPPESVGRPSAVQLAAGSVRDRLRQSCAALPSDARGLLPGMVLGDTSGMNDELRDDARTAGLSHLTAVSGTNVAIVLAVVLALLRPTPLGRRSRGLVAALTLAGFVVLARPGPSVLRAALMGSVVLLALGLGRPRSAVPALLGSVTLLVLSSPDLALAPGFVLSVLATGALLLVAPGWADGLSRWLPPRLAHAVAVPLAAQAAVTPVVVLLSGKISLAAVPANLLAAPAVPAATVLGVLATVLSMVAAGPARLMARVGGLPCGWIAAVAHRSAALPGAAVGWPGGFLGVASAGFVVAAAIAVARRRRLRRLLVAAVAGVVLGALVLVPRTVARWPPADWQVLACDIGQGDALLVRGAVDDPPVLVDTGPDPRAVRRCLDQVGVHRISVIVLSHLHADHVEGLSAVLGHVPTAGVLVNPLDEPALEGRRVRGWAARARVPVAVLSAGQHWSAGGVVFDVLGPEPILHGTDSDPNNDSLVLLARTSALRVLLTGDVEPDAQSNLLARGVPAVDVLKVPHHGSAHQDPRFLAATRARLSLTSVGADNPYGHPSPQTERALADDDITNSRTDLDGAIAVRVTSSGPEAVRQRRVRPGQPAARATIPGGSPELSPLSAKPVLVAGRGPAGKCPALTRPGTSTGHVLLLLPPRRARSPPSSPHRRRAGHGLGSPGSIGSRAASGPSEGEVRGADGSGRWRRCATAPAPAVHSEPGGAVSAPTTCDAGRDATPADADHRR